MELELQKIAWALTLQENSNLYCNFTLLLFQLVIVGVWITSALYSIPKFLFVTTIENELSHGHTETICIAHRKAYNSELFDLINFGLLYVFPLLVMTVSIDVYWFLESYSSLRLP